MLLGQADQGDEVRTALGVYGEMKNTHQSFVGEHEGMRPFR
jgi:hypothetical protein